MELEATKNSQGSSSIGELAAPLRLLSVVSTLVAAAAGFYAFGSQRKAADDWAFASAYREVGFVGFAKSGYLSMNGRILLLVGGGWVSEQPHELWAFVCVAALLLVGWMLSQMIRAATHMRLRSAAYTSALCVTAFVAGAPALGQAMFWPIGALVYMLPCVLAVSAVGALALLTNSKSGSISDRRKHTSLGLFGVISAFFGASGNETLAIALPIVIAGVLWSKRPHIARPGIRGGVKRFRSASWVETAIFASATVGGFVLLLAPGNRARTPSSIYHYKRDVATILSITGTNLLAVVLLLTLTSLLACIALWVVGLYTGRNATDALPVWIAARNVTFFATVCSSIAFAAVCAWGFNSFGPKRAVFPVWALVAASAFLFGAAKGADSNLTQRKSEHRKTLSPVMFAVILAAPGYFALAVGRNHGRDSAVAAQIDCIARELKKSAENGRYPLSIAAPIGVDSFEILPDGSTAGTLKNLYGSGPITRVGLGEGAKCDFEARRLASFVGEWAFRREPSNTTPN